MKKALNLSVLAVVLIFSHGAALAQATLKQCSDLASEIESREKSRAFVANVLTVSDKFEFYKKMSGYLAAAVAQNRLFDNLDILIHQTDAGIINAPGIDGPPKNTPQDRLEFQKRFSKYLAEVVDAAADFEEGDERHQGRQHELSFIEENLAKRKSSYEDLKCASMVSEKGSDLTGTWDIMWTDPYAYYKFQWEITGSDKGGWKLKQTLLDTDHPYNKKLIGTSWSDSTLTLNNSGRLEFMRSSTDSNPGNAGYFLQTAACVVSQNSITCEGTHSGTAITHWIKMTGTKRTK